MLCLTRKPNEWITLTLPSGEKIRITYVKRNGEKVMIGIDAPKNIKIMRDEHGQKR